MNEMNDSSAGRQEPGSGSDAGNGSQAMETVTQRAEVAREEMSTVAHDAKQELRSFADEAKQQVRQRADEQGEHLSAAVREFGDELRTMAGKTDHPDGTAARAVVQVGERVTGMADRMQSQGVNGLMDDLTHYARQHPGQFVAGAAVAGFVVGRLVRNVDKAAIGEQMKGGQDSQSARDQAASPMIDLTAEERPLAGSDTSLADRSDTPPTPGSPSRVGPSVAGIGGEEVGAW